MASLKEMLGQMGNASARQAGVVPGMDPSQMPAAGGMGPTGGPMPQGAMPQGPAGAPPMETLSGAMGGAPRAGAAAGGLPPEVQQVIQMLSQLPPEVIMQTAMQLPPEEQKMMLELAMIANPQMAAYMQQAGGAGTLPQPQMSGAPGAATPLQMAGAPGAGMPPPPGPETISGQLSGGYA